MNKFKFGAVGQGLFYTGSLMHGTYNFIYDCGSKERNYLDAELDGFIKNLPIKGGRPYIDFIVISHLHSDHFLGLQRLLRECKVGKLYLPYLGSNSQFIRFAAAYAVYNGAEGDYELRNSLYEFILFLYRAGDGRFDISLETIEFVGEPDEEKSLTAKALPYEEITVGEAYWKFEIFSRTVDTRILYALYNEIDDLMKTSGAKDVRDLILNYKRGIRKLAERYKEVFGTKTKKSKYGLSMGVNVTSLIMIHYPLYKNALSYFCGCNGKNARDYCLIEDCRFCGNAIENARSATLLTGDATVDKAKYKNLEPALGAKFVVAQIPHHGAAEEWRAFERLNIDACVFAVSFGLGNGYGHPHPDTVRALIDKSLYTVTQTNSFGYIID